MRIGVDASCWVNRRGYGRFTRELLRALVSLAQDHEFIFFIDSASARGCEFPERAKIIRVPVHVQVTKAASSSGRRNLHDVYKMSRAASTEPLDIIFYPSVYSYFPIFSKARRLMTIHDTIPELYPELIFPNWRARLFWRLKVWAAIQQSDMILTVSEFSRNCIRSYLNVGDRPIAVTCEAADERFQCKPGNGEFKELASRVGLSETDRYFLYVGGIAPHKNLRTLVSAYHELIEDNNGHAVKLLIVGDLEGDSFWIDENMRHLARTCRATDGIHFCGRLPDEHLPVLYSNSEALVMPALCEGFGLPAAEAMACGAPVLASKTTSLPEVVAEAGIFFDPRRPTEIKQCMAKILDQPILKAKLGKAGLQRSKSLTWNESAKTVLDVIENLAGGHFNAGNAI